MGRVALREFLDAHGKAWTVWSTTPDRRSALPVDLQAGWLTFESGGQRRRLAPIPAGWEETSIDRLRMYCSVAEALDSARKSDPQGDEVGAID